LPESSAIHGGKERKIDCHFTESILNTAEGLLAMALLQFGIKNVDFVADPDEVKFALAHDRGASSRP